MTTTYPIQELAPFEIDFDRFFGEVAERVREMRHLRRLPPLRPDKLLVGPEQLDLQTSPPSATIVPTGFKFTAARKVLDSIDPKPYWSQWMVIECVCWGNDDPDKKSRLYSFSSALEISREILIALADSNIGPAHVRVDASQWVQESSQTKLGRKLFLRAEVETFVVRDPPIPVMPNAAVTAALQNPEDGSTEPIATFVVPFGGTDPNGPQ